MNLFFQKVICTMPENTLTLKEAAEFLKIHPATLQSKAQSGAIPGAKIGKAWVFVEVDLVEHIRSKYVVRMAQGEQKESSSCHYSDARTPRTGGSKSPSAEKQYRKALGLPIR
jgi:excisionase family DNA binding protein